MNIYDFKMNAIYGEEIDFEKYKGKALLIVNTASKCGFTPQFKGLQKLYEEYKDRDFEILGFPCNQFLEQDPADNNEIKHFCELNYGVDFQMFEKINVRGEDAHPLYKYLTSEAPFKGFDLNNDRAKKLYGVLQQKLPEYLKGNDIKWNFTKFLIDKEGKMVKRFEPYVEPENMAEEIEKVL
jgi:glutathione peroxidase